MATKKARQLINTRSGHTVSGFFRQCADTHSLSTTIPVMLTYLCLYYYFHGEFFEKCGQDLQIQHSRMTITRIKNPKKGYGSKYSNTGYGKLWIPSDLNKIATWTLTMNNVQKKMFIGLVSQDSRQDEDFFVYKDKPMYYISNKGHRDFHDSKYRRGNGPKPKKFKLGNKISLTLNTQKKTIMVNDVLIFEAIDTGNDIKYKIAVSITEKDDSITLIDFEMN